MAYYLSPAKLNLYLKVLGQRDDGYHLIESVFSLINLFDLIHIEPLTDNQIVFQLANPAHPALIDEKDNLVINAARLLKEKTGYLQGATITLYKNIPIGAGLGGGSSNAATTLIALNHLWNTQLSSRELQVMGLKLGADVPFFVMGHNALVTGIGEILSPIHLEKSCYVVVFPNIHLSTKQIFQSLTLTRSESTRIIYGLNDEGVGNHLQAAAFCLHPELEALASSLATFGKPIMTGSGSALFIKTQDKVQTLQIKRQLAGNFQVYCVETLTQHPLNGLKAC